MNNRTFTKLKNTNEEHEQQEMIKRVTFQPQIVWELPFKFIRTTRCVPKVLTMQACPILSGLGILKRET
jgi:hypothetical protein